jgi:hypothetical protein
MVAISPYSLNGIFPEIFVEKIFLEPPSDNLESAKLDIRINFSLQRAKQKTPWYLDDGLKGRLKIFVCFVADEKLARKLTVPRRLRREMLSTKFNPALIKTHIGMEKAIVPPYAEVSSDSTQILDSKNAYAVESLRYSIKTSIKKNANYLSCILIPYLTSPQSSVPSGVSPDAPIQMGNMCIEGIFNQKEVLSNSFIFTLTEGMDNFGKAGEVWIGPVHYNHTMGFMAGPSHTETSHPSLKAQLVANKKILDLRFQKHFRGSLINAQNNEIAGAINEAISSKLLKREKDSNINYFSPLCMSRNKNNTTDLILGFNIVQAVENLTRYPYLYHTAAELRSAIILNDVEVYRKRVTNPSVGNRLTPSPIFNRPIETDQPDELVGSISNGKLKVLNYSVDEKIMHFVVRDEGMQAIAEGEYQYGISIKFTDNTTVKLRSALKAMRRSLQGYKKYVQLAQDPNVYDFPTNQFKQRYITKLYSDSKAWSDLVNKYIAIVLLVFGRSAFVQYSIPRWQRNLLNMTDPRSASIESILEFEGFAISLVEKLSSITGKAAISNADEQPDVGSRVRSSGPSGALLEIKHDFMTPYEAKDKNDRGVRYFNSRENSSELLNISYSDWARRVQRESTMFSSTSPQARSIQRNGFLTPYALETPNQSIGVRQNMNSEDSLAILNAKLNPYREDFGPRNLGPSVIMALKQQLMGYRGVSIEGLKQNIAEYKDRSSKKIDLYDSANVVGERSHFVPDEDHMDSVSGSHIAVWTGTNSIEESVLNSDLATDILNEISLNFMPLEATSLDQIAGSYAAQKLRQAPEIVQESNAFEFNVNYNTEAVVQVLSGYREIDGESYVIAPQWTSLGTTSLESLAKGGFLVCRLRRVNTITGQQNAYELPVYNEYFILGEPPSLSSNLPSPGFSTNIHSYATVLQDEMSRATINRGNQELPIAYLKSTAMISLNAPAIKRRAKARSLQKTSRGVVTRK